MTQNVTQSRTLKVRKRSHTGAKHTWVGRSRLVKARESQELKAMLQLNPMEIGQVSKNKKST